MIVSAPSTTTSDGVIQVAIKIDPNAEITHKQFNLIKKLASERDWHRRADVSISLLIKTVMRFTPSADDPDALPPVKRALASQAISYMLDPKSAPPVTPTTSKNIHVPVTSGAFPGKWNELTDLLAKLPISKYAVWSESLKCWTFLEVREHKMTKKRYLNKLLGAPGTWAWATGVSVNWMVEMATVLLASPTQYALNYCEQFTRCSACDSPLSNAKSIAEAMGPVCRKKFTW
jgi:Family of unknown function (DUF6011)